MIGAIAGDIIGSVYAGSRHKRRKNPEIRGRVNTRYSD